MMLNIAVIGGGLTGLLVGDYLQSRANVTIFDKARGVGGRLSTRYAGDYEFDHGAPYFNARSLAFQEEVNTWQRGGVVNAWRPRVLNNGQITVSEVFYVGVPKMNALSKYLARTLPLILQTEIKQCLEKDEFFYLEDTKSNLYGPFDWVIVTAPFPQTQTILQNPLASMNVTMQACYALMLGYAEPFHLDWDVAVNQAPCLSRVFINHQKPQRTTAASVVAFYEFGLDIEPLDIKENMLEALFELISKQPSHIDGHLWRYARAGQQESPQIYIDKDRHIIAGGDWSVDGSVEGAFFAAKSIIHQLQEFL
jgi:renalase